MVIFVICFALSVIANAGAQFSSGVSLVEVYATVLDHTGEPVSDLPVDVFSVEEDGRPQTIATFSSGDLPLALAIGIDRSFSVSSERLSQVTAAVQRLLGNLTPADRVTLLAIGSEVEVLAPLSDDRRAAYDALLGLRPWGTSPLHDAVVQAVDAIQPAAGRRALILISDGSDRYSETSAAAMLAHARTRDVLVYPVALGRRQPDVFVDLAALTGGRSFAVTDMRMLPPTLETIARELRHQYLLGYAPAGDTRTGWHSITVRVNRPGVRVRARNGYVASR
jgi:Ca-activated chloride channel family protein